MKKFCLFIIVFFAIPFTILAQSTNIEAELRKRWDTFIEYWEKEDVDKLVSIYTENAINIPPGLKKNEGRKAISEFYRFLFDNNASSRYTHKMIDVHSNDIGATEYGEFSVDWTRNDGSKWTYYARSITYWEKNAEGQWQIQMFLFNQPPQKE